MRFQDKVAIVTGGNSGMGKEVARRFVAEGGRVVVNGRNAAKTEAAVKDIDPTGKLAVAQIGDVALPATGEAAVKSRPRPVRAARCAVQQCRDFYAEAVP